MKLMTGVFLHEVVQTMKIGIYLFLQPRLSLLGILVTL